MAKPPPKKRQPTLRELLERDAKNPMREIGLSGDFKKTAVEDSISDLDLGMLGQSLESRNYQDKVFNVESRDAYKIPMPKTSVAEFVVDAFLGAKPAGDREDTERAKIADWKTRTNYGKNTPEDVYGMTALGSGPSYPRQSKVSKLMGVTNKKAGK